VRVLVRVVRVGKRGELSRWFEAEAWIGVRRLESGNEMD
jgi:hypothetical protein